MTDLFDHQTTRTSGTINTIAAAIGADAFNKRVLFEAMTELHGGGSADGQWTQRDAFEMMEAGVVQHLAAQVFPAELTDVAAFGDLVQSLPTQTVRSEDQIRFQQFSTPADLAALAAVLAQPRPDDFVLEPSAGHGMLAVMLPQVAALHLNELDPRRREKLQMLFTGATITGIDGTMLTSLMAAEVRSTLTIMNPPFSRSEGRGSDSFAAVRHLRSAIAKTAPGGRIVAIMPDWFTTSVRMEAAYKETLADCTVATSCRLSRCYQKQGTSVAVRLYVVDKAPGNISPTVIARGQRGGAGQRRHHSCAAAVACAICPAGGESDSEACGEAVAVPRHADRSTPGSGADANGASYRKGYFLGDGTGAGKGRQVAGCIHDNWLAGRRKAIWISKNEPLLEDARRDWTALGGVAAELQHLSAW